MTLLSVLDGPAHCGMVLDLDSRTTVVERDGVVYREADGLYAHEQHGWVRWLRVEEPV